MKHISVIVGGGHPNGDIAQLVDSFVCGAKEAGHKVKKISLSKIKIRGCLGCNACRKRYD